MLEPLLLCTDLDRTLLPNGAAPESPDARRLFTGLVALPEVTLAYVSGRDRARIAQAMHNYRLPRPDFAISDVGSNIYDLRSGDWQSWSRWHDEISPDWAGFDRERLAALLAGVDAIRAQEYSRQNTFKLSYYFSLHSSRTELDEQINSRLRAQGIRASRIWSIDEPAGVGLLDVVPESATKLHAVEFLRAHLGVSPACTLFAGDSGNDLQVLASGVPAVLVNNASATVAAEATALADAQGHLDTLYCARGGFLGMNGNYAAGILEGVAHFRPDLREMLEALAATA